MYIDLHFFCEGMKPSNNFSMILKEDLNIPNSFKRGFKNLPFMAENTVYNYSEYIKDHDPFFHECTTIQ